MFRPVLGADYENAGKIYVLMGLKSSGFVLQEKGAEEATGYLTVPKEEFLNTFTEGEHDHVNHCCVIHHIHVMPHRGCMLR